MKKQQLYREYQQPSWGKGWLQALIGVAIDPAGDIVYSLLRV